MSYFSEGETVHFIFGTRSPWFFGQFSEDHSGCGSEKSASTGRRGFILPIVSEEI